MKTATQLKPLMRPFRQRRRKLEGGLNMDVMASL